MTILAFGFLTFALVWAASFGGRAAWTAGGKARGRGRWFLFGAVLGPLALAILHVAPPGTCSSCLSPVTGWSMTCPVCREDVRTNPRLMALNRVAEPEPAVAARMVGAPVATRAAPGRRPYSDASPVGTASNIAASPAAPTPAAAAARPAAAAVGPVAGPQPSAPSSGPAWGAATEPQRRSSDLPPRAAPSPAASEHPATFPGVPVLDAPAAAPRNEGMRDATTRLDLDPRRPMRLGSGIFVDGSERLIPGYWYDLSTGGGNLSISGTPGSVPGSVIVSRPLSEIRLKQRGDRLEITVATDSTTFLWLSFRSMLDWTPFGLANEVEVRRRASGVGDAAIR